LGGADVPGADRRGQDQDARGHGVLPIGLEFFVLLLLLARGGAEHNAAAWCLLLNFRSRFGRLQTVEGFAMLAIRHAAATDPGKHHKRNEDRHYSHAERGLYFVTDGMANEVTPHFVLETLPPLIRDEFAGVDDLSGRGPAD